MTNADERLERIKKRGFGILTYFVEHGSVSEMSESSHEDDIFILQRDALRAVKELGSQEMCWKMKTRGDCMTKLKPGDKVMTGQRLGRIKLGSQVTLIMPKDKIKLAVKKGQKVKAGSTIIGKIL